MELVWSVLPFVAFLACPLMMVLCMMGMRKAGCASPQAGSREVVSTAHPQQVEALQHRLQAIQAELASLRTTEAGAVDADAPGQRHRAEEFEPQPGQAAGALSARSMPPRDRTVLNPV